MITKEEREEWREEAVDEQSIWINRQAGRILRLLDALDEAEAKMYEMDLHTGGARVVQCKSCQEAETRAERVGRAEKEAKRWHIENARLLAKLSERTHEKELLEVRAEKAERERDVLARKLMEDNTSLEYGYELPEGFQPRFEPETDTHAVQFWIEWAAQEAAKGE